MSEPRIVPRAEHALSRRDIDPDALKVLYRLRQGDHIAYLVGGSVRDLLLQRRPKDFDIGTSAHPYQVKKLFRNCWIIGRRFRLAHVKFGTKTLEVATFRRQVQPGEEVVADGVPAPIHEHHHHHDTHDENTPHAVADNTGEPIATSPDRDAAAHDDHLLHRDNTFGTPEEDAFRRDFTVNALFYDIATFSIIDYVGGLEDLHARVVRCIGDPDVRLPEDPVRMLRAVALSARLDFTIDPPLLDAIHRLRHEIAKSSPPRMLEEYYKILRSGAAEKTFRGLADAGLLEPISVELHEGATERFWDTLATLDRYRAQFESIPETLTNAVLLGTLLVPLGLADQIVRWIPPADEKLRRKGPQVRLGELPLARRDVERLRQVLMMQRRLTDLTVHARTQRALMQRGVFNEALTWLEIYGRAPEIVAHWRALQAALPDAVEPGNAIEPTPADAEPRRRRRRRRRRRPGPGSWPRGSSGNSGGSGGSGNS